MAWVSGESRSRVVTWLAGELHPPTRVRRPATQLTRTLVERRAMARELLGEHDLPRVRGWRELADRLERQDTEATLRSVMRRLDATQSSFVLLREQRAADHTRRVASVAASMGYWLVFSSAFAGTRRASRSDLDALELRTAYLGSLATLRTDAQDRLVVLGSIATRLARDGALLDADLASERACRERPRDAQPLPECVEHSLPRETRAGPDGDDPEDAAPRTCARACRDRSIVRRDSPWNRLRGPA
ncbi:MAG: hypothetical protein ACTHOE_14785 [Conexibacter sp.]